MSKKSKKTTKSQGKPLRATEWQVIGRWIIDQLPEVATFHELPLGLWTAVLQPSKTGKVVLVRDALIHFLRQQGFTEFHISQFFGFQDPSAAHLAAERHKGKMQRHGVGLTEIEESATISRVHEMPEAASVIAEENVPDAF